MVYVRLHLEQTEQIPGKNRVTMVLPSVHWYPRFETGPAYLEFDILTVPNEKGFQGFNRSNCCGLFCSPCRTWTYDPLINSWLIYIMWLLFLYNLIAPLLVCQGFWSGGLLQRLNVSRKRGTHSIESFIATFLFTLRFLTNKGDNSDTSTRATWQWH